MTNYQNKLQSHDISARNHEVIMKAFPDVTEQGTEMSSTRRHPLLVIKESRVKAFLLGLHFLDSEAASIFYTIYEQNKKASNFQSVIIDHLQSALDFKLCQHVHIFPLFKKQIQVKHTVNANDQHKSRF